MMLVNIDCMAAMQDIPDHSISLVLCDLPYGTTSCKWDSPLPLPELWKEYERMLRPKGNIVLFGTGLFAYRLALSNEKLYRYDLVWKKSKCGSPLTAKYMPMKRHELILVFGHPGAIYNPQMTKGKPYKRKYTHNKVNNMGFGISGVITDNLGTRQPISVLDFPQRWRRQDQVHPTQKPVELLEWLVRTYSNDGDTVLDNCMGSGSTGVACVRQNRKFIGMESDRKFFEIAVERINKETELVYGKKEGRPEG